MLKKLGLLKMHYQSGARYLSVQEDIEMLNRIQSQVESFFHEQKKATTIESAFGGNGVTDGRAAFSFFCDDGTQGKSFLKVNVPGSDKKEALYREYRILSQLYGEEDFKFYDISPEIGALEMKLLQRLSSPLEPGKVKELMKRSFDGIGDRHFKRDIIYDISDILRTSCEEMLMLYNRGLMDQEDVLTCQKLLDYVASELNNVPRCLCHGDFSDANIMTDGEKLFVIDWEDVFWGFEQYDYLFWLTFIAHRKYYSKELLGNNEEERKFNIGIMVMIIIVKEAMSVYSGEYKKNKFTAHDRINEVTVFL